MVKVTVHALDIAPLRSEAPPQKRSGMASVLKDFTVLPAHPHVHPQSEWAISVFTFPEMRTTCSCRTGIASSRLQRRCV